MQMTRPVAMQSPLPQGPWSGRAQRRYRCSCPHNVNHWFVSLLSNVFRMPETSQIPISDLWSRRWDLCVCVCPSEHNKTNETNDNARCIIINGNGVVFIDENAFNPWWWQQMVWSRGETSNQNAAQHQWMAMATRKKIIDRTDRLRSTTFCWHYFVFFVVFFFVA